MSNTTLMKKYWIPAAAVLIVALLAGAWAVGEAFAQDSAAESGFLGRWRIARRGLGQVLSISEDRFVVERLNGEEFTLLVTAETAFRDRAGAELSYEDLEVGRWVVVVPQRGEEETLLARLVVLLPEDFAPDQYLGARGLIASVDLAASQFILETREGEELLFDVDENTRFGGQARELADLEAEMRAFVGAREMEDGSLLAKAVLARDPGQRSERWRYAGQITGVDLAGSAFSLETRRGDQELTFFVDENTNFRGREGAVGSLEDLEAGMYCLVVAREDQDGSLTALVVAAATADQLPKFEARMVGRIASVEHNSFVIKVLSGDEYNVQTNGSTIFRSRIPGIDGLEDLKPGMVVAVGGKELGNGTFQYQADLVIVLRAAR